MQYKRAGAAGPPAFRLCNAAQAACLRAACMPAPSVYNRLATSCRDNYTDSGDQHAPSLPFADLLARPAPLPVPVFRFRLPGGAVAPLHPSQ